MITISGYPFEGPYANSASLADNAGVYAILTRGQDNESWTVIDVGESGQIKSRIENHDRKACWNRNSRGTVTAAVLYTAGWNSTQRCVLESSIREQFAPACGLV
jgi:hypothetical protein